MFAIDLATPRTVMGKSSVVIDQPIQKVFSFVAWNFFENYPKWAPEVIEFKPINDNAMAVGALAKQTRIDQGQKMESVFEVVTLEQNKLLELQGLSEPYNNRYDFNKIDTNKTQLTFFFELQKLDLFMIPFEKLIRTAIEEGTENSVENIKNLLMDEQSSS